MGSLSRGGSWWRGFRRARLGAALADARPTTAEPAALSGEVLAGRSWAPLPDRYERIARTGEAAGYASGSEARQAVLASAANRGWRLADVEARVEDGRWSGLRGLYARYRGGWQRALRRDWAKAVGWAGTKSPGSVSGPDTSPNTHRGGTAAATDRDQISPEWISVFLDAVANASPRWGRHAGRNRAVLQSLAYAGWQARSRVIDWGVRSYALGGGLGRSTVAVVLAELAAEDDPFLVRVAAGVYEQADTFRLRLPDTVSLRRAGPTLKPRPVPDVLIDRPKSGLGVYQALSSRPRTADELAARSRYGRATVYRRLAELAELGLARRGPRRQLGARPPWAGRRRLAHRRLLAAGLSAAPLPPGTAGVAGPARRLAPPGRAHPHPPNPRRPGPPPSPRPAGRHPRPGSRAARPALAARRAPRRRPVGRAGAGNPGRARSDDLRPARGGPRRRARSTSTAFGCTRGGAADIGPDPADPAVLPTRHRAWRRPPHRRGGQAGRHARPGPAPPPRRRTHRLPELRPAGRPIELAAAAPPGMDLPDLPGRRHHPHRRPPQPARHRTTPTRTPLPSA